jgi:hypothetical protein
MSRRRDNRAAGWRRFHPGLRPQQHLPGASGKLGQYIVQHALGRGYDVVGVCREGSVARLDRFKGRITVVPGVTNDRDVIRRAVAGCDGVLTLLAAWGTRWTVVRGSDREDGEGDSLIHEGPAIVGRQTASALAYAAAT